MTGFVVFGPPESHRCAWGARCGRAETDPREVDPETGRPVRHGALITDGPLCPACMERLKRAVKGLPRDYQRLSDEIGERRTADGAKVAMSTELPVNINVRREMLLTQIVEIADRAADVVETELTMTGAGRHRAGSPSGMERRGYRASGAATTGSPTVTIDMAVKLLLSALDVLAEAEAQPHTLWAPLPDSDEECDKYPQGQPRQIVELSGVDVAYRIVQLSSDVYHELGLDRLRHSFVAPCPAWLHRERRYCQAETVGRDDGSSIVDCETCGATWNEDEYWFIEGLVLDEIEEREEHELLRYLLAEAYWRLDAVRDVADALGQVLDPEDVRQIICNAVTEGGADRAADKTVELLDLAITEIAVGRVSRVLELGAVDAEGEPIGHTRPEQREIAARDHEQSKQDKAKARRKEAVQR